MNDTTSLIHQYCADHTSPASTLLKELERETHLKTLAPQMISGPLQGRFLSLISHMMGPKLIVEIGTFTGYGTLCLAEGLHPEGKIITIDINPELKLISEKYFNQSIYSQQIVTRMGDAKNIIVDEDLNQIDLVFIDAAKSEYELYFDIVINRVRPGGIIIADNVLWSGKVVTDNKDADTISIRSFNDKIAHDDRVEQLMLHIRDGLMLIRKIQ